MSDHQPPSGTPDYLDSGYAAPPPDPATPAERPRRSRRTTWWVGGGVVGLLALGAGAWAALSFFQQGPQPAEALPASTIAYVGVDLDPSGGQKIDAFRTLNKFPAFKDKVGIHSTDDVRRKIGDAIIKGTGCDLTFDADIDPWLGDRAAFAAVDLGHANPDVVIVVQVKDDAKAESGLHTLTTCGDTPATDIGYDVNNGWAVLAQSQQLADTVVSQTKNGSLADDATYRRWTKAVGDAGVVNMYAAPAAGDYLAGKLSSLEGSLGGLGFSQTSTSQASTSTQPTAYTSRVGVTEDAGSQLEQSLKNFQGAAATIRFTGDGLELATASDPGLSQSNSASDQGGAVVSRLPNDTAAALGIGLKSGWFTQVIDRFATGQGQTGDQLMSDLSRRSGLDLPADAETLLGSSAALSVSKDFDYEAAANSSDGVGVPVAFTVRGDPAAIGKVLDKVRANAGTGTSSSAPLSSDSSGDLVVVGPTAAYRKSVLAGGHLGDTDAFRSVIPDAGHASVVLFVNVDDLEKALSQLDGADQQVSSNIAPLQAFGFSAWMEGNVARTSLKVSTN